MRRIKWAGGVVAGVMAMGSVASADTTVFKNEDVEVKVGAMTQVMGVGQYLEDPSRSDARVYLFMKSARLRVSGEHERGKLNLELGLGPEDVIVAPTPGIALGLLDLDAEVRLGSKAYLKVGQYKVPYGREQLTYSGEMQYPGRSIQNLGSLVGRDVGISAVVKPGPFTLIGGVFTGGGRNVPERYLPQKIGIPLAVARIGVGNADEDPFRLSQHTRVEKLQWAVHANGLYTKDSLVGHSSVLNVKTADRSLVLNPNWNPYIGQRPLDEGSFYQYGADAVVRAPVGNGLTVAGEVQVDQSVYENTYGRVQLTGARVQGSVAKGNLEGGLRYAALFTDDGFRVGDQSITGGSTIHEVTPAVTYHLGRHAKLIAALPVVFNAPVILEPNFGAYAATDHPDQTAQLSRGSTVEAQTLVQGRLMFQAQF